MTAKLGAIVAGGRTRFAVRAPRAHALDLCLFGGGEETRRAMTRQGDDFVTELPGDLSGAKYGFRARGPWEPETGNWFDPSKLLVDPYAKELDRRFVQRPELNQYGADTASFVPRAIVQPRIANVQRAAPLFRRGNLIYELNVRSFSILHPDVPERLRGTIAALAHPAIIAHLKKLCVGAVELMPIVAWIDERHLPPLGLVNSWGYNPVTPMALDPGLCPGGVAELRRTVDALHRAGIGVFLDLVFNHSGESDAEGGVLSFRGLDNDVYARRADGQLINVTGTGNTLDFANPAVRALCLDALRHFVVACGIDGFRFDLATVLARGPEFKSDAAIFGEIAADPVLADRIMIAEPWDIGDGGYRLGQFPANWLEWNDRYRDDVRRFWRGDRDVTIGTLATRLAGSSDIFPGTRRGVSYLAAHDGMTLADLTAFEARHNEANGEDNRDGHHQNYSWNSGVEGASSAVSVKAARRRDLEAMLGTLFSSNGTIMLTAGDEFGRSQRGNNNAYCQDNEISWLDWAKKDQALEDNVVRLAMVRADNLECFGDFPEDAVWLDLEGRPLRVEQWEDPQSAGLRLRFACGDKLLTVEIDRKGRVALLAIGNGSA